MWEEQLVDPSIHYFFLSSLQLNPPAEFFPNQPPTPSQPLKNNPPLFLFFHHPQPLTKRSAPQPVTQTDTLTNIPDHLHCTDRDLKIHLGFSAICMPFNCPFFHGPQLLMCCAFQPANGCSACRLLVEIDFLMLKQLFPSLTELTL